MINTHFVELIRPLKPSLQQDFLLFLESKLFNNGVNAIDLIKLYQVILNAAPGFEEELLNKEALQNQVFSGSDIVVGKLEKRMVELNKLLRIFLLIKRYLSENNEMQQQVDWVSCVREAGLDGRAQALLSKLKSPKKEQRDESLERYKLDLTIAEEEHELESLQNQFKGDLSIPNLIKQLDLYYLNYRLELSNRYLLQQKGIPLPSLEDQESNQKTYQESSLLFQISTKIRDLLKKDHPTADEFQNLFRILLENEKFISFQTQKQLFVYLRNFCTLLINAGRIEFVSVLHQIHQDNLRRGLFFINNEISSHSYINMVQIAIRAKGIEWAMEFTETYRKKIIGGDKEKFFYFSNLAHCLFAQGKWEEALEKMPEPSTHSHYHGMIRLLELKAYYELRSDLLHYKMYAFRKYFERTAAKKVPVTARTMYIEFFNILLQLTQSPLKDKIRSQRIIERIQKKKLLADRAWLLEKARELA